MKRTKAKHGKIVGGTFSVRLTQLLTLVVTPRGTQLPRQLNPGEIWMDWDAWEAMQAFVLAVDSESRRSRSFDRVVGEGLGGTDSEEAHLLASISAAMDVAGKFSTAPAAGRARHAR